MLILHDDSRNSLSEWTTEGHGRPLGDLNYIPGKDPWVTSILFLTPIMFLALMGQKIMEIEGFEGPH